MKKIIFFLVVIIISISAQEKNKIVIDEKSEKPMLIGFCDRTVFADTNFAWWYNSEYDNYEFNNAVVDSLKELISDIKVSIIMGSWCSDSRREVPRLFRIFDTINFADSNVTIIAVDRKKESPVGNVKELDIKFVPTFIFYKNSIELGRIVETPKENLENDLLSILK